MPPCMTLICFFITIFPPCTNPLYKRDLETSVPLTSPPCRIKPSFFPSIYFLVTGAGGGRGWELQGISPKKGLAPYFCSLPADTGVVQSSCTFSSCTFSSCCSGAAMASPEGPFPAPAQPGHGV